MTHAEREAIRAHNQPPHGKADRTISALLAEVERLREALVMAHKYAGCGHEPGALPKHCRVCAALADGAPVADVAPGTTNGTETDTGTGTDAERARNTKGGLP